MRVALVSWREYGICSIRAVPWYLVCGFARMVYAGCCADRARPAAMAVFFPPPRLRVFTWSTAILVPLEHFRGSPGRLSCGLC